MASAVRAHAPRRSLACAACAERPCSLATAVLLAGPTVLAFLTGGYFDGPRFGAGGGRRG